MSAGYVGTVEGFMDGGMRSVLVRKEVILIE